MSLNLLIKSLGRNEILVPHLINFLRKERKEEVHNLALRKKHVIRDAELAMMAFRKRRDEFNHGEEIEGDYFHPSAIGKCLRMLWLHELKFDPRAKAAPTVDEVREYLVFEIGTYLHILMQNLISRAGLLVKREVAIQNKELRTLGHADGIVKIHGQRYVLEIKTINTNSFAMLGKNPKPEHIAQVVMYMAALAEKKALILYVDKNTGQLKEFYVPFSQSYYEENVKRRVTRYFDCVAKRLMPPREGKQANAFPCTYCPYVLACYGEEAKLLQKLRAKHEPKSKSKRCEAAVPQNSKAFLHQLAEVSRIPLGIKFGKCK
jgi:CRISPR-associated exonuclease Cas4